MWTDDRVEQLKALWTEGLSCSQIARALNAGGVDLVTRNAVIGKVTRLGLAARLHPTAPRTPHVHRARATYRDAPLDPPPVVLAPLLDSDGRHFTVLTIQYFGQCKFPYDAPEAEGGCIFCAQPIPIGESWCEPHKRVVFSPAKTQQRANVRAETAMQKAA